MNKTTTLLTVFISLSLPLLLGLTALDSVWTDMEIYKPVFATNRFDFDSAIRTTQELTHYFQEPMSQPFNITGFSLKEKSHLHDVKSAFKLGGLVFGLLLTLWFFVFLHCPALAAKSLIFGGILTIVALGIAAALPFDFLFTLFHNALFEPGTWVFYPGELLVTIYPQRLFSHLAEIVAWRTAALGFIAFIFGYRLFRLEKSRSRIVPR